MNQCLRSLACVVAVAALAFVPAELAAKSSHKSSAPKKTHEAKAGKQRHASPVKSRHGKHRRGQAQVEETGRRALGQAGAAAADRRPCASRTPSISRARARPTCERRARTPCRSGRAEARRMVHAAPSGHEARFERYPAFIADNPDWPSSTLMRRRAEARLWQEKSDAATVHDFTRDQPAERQGPLRARARAWLAEGDREDAARLVREAVAHRRNCPSATKPMRSRHSAIC